LLKRELRNVSFFARISINKSEEEKYLANINEMLDYVEILQEPDVSGLMITTHVTELRNVWREDVVKKCSKEMIIQLLDTAPDKERNFYKIQKVIGIDDESSLFE
jgi:aspartyl-tRNA(Asn)/glutamyl-tRNA(Gln) amidotransferase subunit C